MKYVLKICYYTLYEDEIIICDTLKDALHKIEYTYNHFNVIKVSLKRADAYQRGEIVHVQN